MTEWSSYEGNTQIISALTSFLVRLEQRVMVDRDGITVHQKGYELILPARSVNITRDANEAVTEILLNDGELGDVHDDSFTGYVEIINLAGKVAYSIHVRDVRIEY